MFNSSGRKKLIIYIILAAASLIVYWQVSQFNFINFDDPVYIMENSYVKSGITMDGSCWAFTTKHTGLWNPLVWMSFMLDYELYGLNAGGYHVTNLILHILSTLLLFWLFHRMTGQIWPSAFVAAFFALHPLHVESVAWISERKDVLSAFFWMLTLCCYVYYTEKPIIKRYLLVLFSFVLALMSKPMVITLPLIMMLLDYWPLKRFQSKKANVFWWQLKEKLPFLILSLAAAFITLYHPNNQYFLEFTLGSRVANAPVAFVTYLSKTFWPHRMVIFYPFPAQTPIWQVIGSTILIIGITVAVISKARRLPYLLVGWIWHMIILLPVIGIIQISLYALADHYNYLPSIGIAVMLAWGVPSLLPNKYLLNKILLPAVIIIILVWSVLAWRQCSYWRDSIPLFNHNLHVTENNYIAHGHLGGALFSEGKVKEAIDHYNEAVRLMPGYFDTVNNRGTAYHQLGQYDQALEDYNMAIRLKPDYAEAYNNRGIVNSELGHNKEAIEDFSKAIILNPFFANAYSNRAVVYINSEDTGFGCRDAKKACELGNCSTLQLSTAKGLCR